MYPGPFNTFLSRHTQVEESTVTHFTRLLREAGYITTGARGRHAPHMQPVDAARALIAMMATDRPSGAVEAVQRWCALRLDRTLSKGALPERLFGDDPSLEGALIRLLDLADDPLQWAGPPFAAFELKRGEKIAALKAMDDTWCATFTGDQRPGDVHELFGIRRTCYLAPGVMNDIAVEMWADRKERGQT
jgi:hypothetical protein